MNSVEPIRDPLKIIAIKRILKKEKNPRNYLLFVMGINLALRISDLLALKVKDVVNEKGEIADYIYLKEKKTNKSKKIKVNQVVKEALQFFFSKSHLTDPEQFLFTSLRSNKTLDRVQVWQLINKWCRNVGLYTERYGTHTLRKTWGYQARMQGVSLERIQAKLGHTSPSVTRRYIGISQEEINRIEDEICL